MKKMHKYFKKNNQAEHYNFLPTGGLSFTDFALTDLKKTDKQ